MLTKVCNEIIAIELNMRSQIGHDAVVIIPSFHVSKPSKGERSTSHKLELPIKSVNPKSCRSSSAWVSVKKVVFKPLSSNQSSKEKSIS